MVFQSQQGSAPGNPQGKDQGKAPERKPDLKTPSQDKSALEQSTISIKGSYPLLPLSASDGQPLVKNMETLQKLDDACERLKPLLDTQNGDRDRKTTLGSLRANDIQSKIDSVVKIEDSYAALRDKKNPSAEEKATADGFFKQYNAALGEYSKALDAAIERMDVASKQNGNPYAAYAAAKERYEKELNKLAPTTTDHTSQQTTDSKQLEAAMKACQEAGAKLLAFEKIYITRARADIKKADDTFFAKFGF